jgi:hypothetical protein
VFSKKLLKNKKQKKFKERKEGTPSRAIWLLLLSIAKGTYNYDALKETSLVHTREVNSSPFGGWNVPVTIMPSMECLASRRSVCPYGLPIRTLHNQKDLTIF